MKFYQMFVALMGFTDPLVFIRMNTVLRLQFAVTDSASFCLVLRNTLGLISLEHAGVLSAQPLSQEVDSTESAQLCH